MKLQTRQLFCALLLTALLPLGAFASSENPAQTTPKTFIVNPTGTLEMELLQIYDDNYEYWELYRYYVKLDSPIPLQVRVTVTTRVEVYNNSHQLLFASDHGWELEGYPNIDEVDLGEFQAISSGMNGYQLFTMEIVSIESI